jgi:hypothetical protein
MHKKMCITVILSLIVMTSTTFADEKLPVLKVGSETYSNVTVTEVTATDIYLISDRGLANAKLKDLDPALQKHFHYDPAAAAAGKQHLGNTQFHIPVIGTNNHPSIADLEAEMNDAISQVQQIVNQPVTTLPRTPDMQVSIYHPGWFHPGAEKPDFNTVDIRATQLDDYDQHEYVTSDLNPGVAFIGNELEFNPMTKYFYTDRSLPKKKLTEDEMLEINRLYRIIGKCEQQLDEIQHPRTPFRIVYLWVTAHKPATIAILAGLYVTLVFLRKRRSQELEV